MAVNALPLVLLAGAAFLLMRSEDEEDETNGNGNGNGDQGTDLPGFEDDEDDEGGGDKPDAQDKPEADAKTEIVIYSAPWCTACQKLKNYLGKHDFEYTIRDIEADASAAEELKAIGIEQGFPSTGVPVLIITSPGQEPLVIRGFDKSAISAELGIPSRIQTIVSADDPTWKAYEEGVATSTVVLVGSNPGLELESMLMAAAELSAEGNNITYLNLPRGSEAAMAMFKTDIPDASLASESRDMFIFTSNKNMSAIPEGGATADWINIIIFGGAGLEDGAFRQMLSSGLSTEALSQSAGAPTYYAYHQVELPASDDPQRAEKLESLVTKAAELFAAAAVEPLETSVPDVGEPGQMASLGPSILQVAADGVLA